MKRLLLILSVVSLNGCAVVAVGAAAVSVTTTAVGVAWDVGKAGVKGWPRWAVRPARRYPGRMWRKRRRHLPLHPLLQR